MSQPAISAAVAGLPRPYSAAGPTHPAPAAPASTRAPAAINAPTRSGRDLDIAHLAGRVDAPGLDRIVVIDGAGPAHLAQLPIGRLNVPGIVDNARLQQRPAAVPSPVDAKPGQ